MWVLMRIASRSAPRCCRPAARCRRGACRGAALRALGLASASAVTSPPSVALGGRRRLGRGRRRLGARRVAARGGAGGGLADGRRPCRARRRPPARTRRTPSRCARRSRCRLTSSDLRADDGLVAHAARTARRCRRRTRRPARRASAARSPWPCRDSTPLSVDLDRGAGHLAPRPGPSPRSGSSR